MVCLCQEKTLKPDGFKFLDPAHDRLQFVTQIVGTVSLVEPGGVKLPFEFIELGAQSAVFFFDALVLALEGLKLNQ